MSTKQGIFDGFVFAYLAMAALVGLVNPNREQLLNLDLNSLIFGGLFIFGFGISYILNRIGVKTAGAKIFEAKHKKTHGEVIHPWLKTLAGWQILTVLVVTFSLGAILTQFSFIQILDSEGFAGAQRLFKGLASPNFEVLPSAVLNILETIFIAFMATALAIPVAFFLGFATAKNIMKHPAAFAVYAAIRILLNVTRSVEALIWAIIFSVWVGIGPFAGMLALMIHSIASLAKQYSEIVETVNEGPIEGIQSTGANGLQVIWFAIVPQVVLPFISYTIYRWDINVRMATIIGLVGGGGIGTMLMKYYMQAMWQEVGCIILVIAIVVWAMDLASAYLREALK